MRSGKVVDLRKKKAGGHMPLPLLHTLGKRSSPLKAKRRRTRILFALGALVLLAGAAWGVSYLSYLPLFSIREVIVSGTKDLRARLVRAEAESVLYGGGYTFLSDSNIFLYPKGEIERAIKDFFPRVKSARISRDSLLATAVVVTIDEHEAFARWCLGEECYVLSEGGLVFAQASADDQPSYPYVFRGYITATSSAVGQNYLPEHFVNVRTLLQYLEERQFSPREVNAENDQDFSIRLARGFDLRASFDADPGVLVKNLELILSSESLRGREDNIEYIDLRFGNRVYYKFKGASAQQTAQ